MTTNLNDNEAIKPGNNSDREDNDKAPGEEQGKAEEVTPVDLKGKNVDGDPTTKEGKPVDTVSGNDE